MATGIIRAPAKYIDIILKSQLIQSGCPTVYHLKPTTENTGNLTRMTLGEKNVNMINKTILVVGETGTGKSTLINVLVNYAMGVELGDDVWFEIVERERGRQSSSQTSDVIVYQIFGFEGKTLPFSLTIIDTPGYGDTRTDKDDDIISKRLLDWFSTDDGVHELNAVGLVLKASENRLSDRLSYVFNSVVSLFGKNVEKNIVALMTHSDGMTPENALKALEDAKIEYAKNTENQPLYFMFNNRQSTQRTSQNKFALKFAWDLTLDQLHQFTEFLKTTGPQKLSKTVDVLNERILLTACIVNLRQRVEFIELQQREMDQEKNHLDKCKEKMNKNENYTVEVDEAYKAKQPIEGGYWGASRKSYKGAMSCLVCEETCHHEGCIHAIDSNDSRCVIFDKDGNCEVCTKKCSRRVHVKKEWIFVNMTRKVKKTDEDMKKKYLENETGAKSHQSALTKMQIKMKELQTQKHKCLEESFQHIENLEKISLKVDSLSTLSHLDFLIDKMTEERYKGKVQELKEMRRRMDQGGLRQALMYKKKAAANK